MAQVAVSAPLWLEPWKEPGTTRHVDHARQALKDPMPRGSQRRESE
jgi:hypothetical protein